MVDLRYLAVFTLGVAVFARTFAVMTTAEDCVTYCSTRVVSDVWNTVASNFDFMLAAWNNGIYQHTA